MIVIAHRGNLDGPNPEKENHPDYLLEALKQGFDVEADVWLINDKFVLGHDSPQYEVEGKWIFHKRYQHHGIWCHAKNAEALEKLIEPGFFAHAFFHDVDDCTLTNYGYVWTYPGKKLISNSIAVMPERVTDWNYSKAVGVCTDFPNKYKP